MADNSDPEPEQAELVTLNCKECYVYVPLPPATAHGHRAELWNVEKWLKAVKLRVVTRGDNLFIRLEDQESGELFAECPVPNDLPITTAIEPVIDSSRYFVMKLVDRETKKHAFIGLGFRDRADASNFNAALDDHRQYLRRRQEALRMKEEFEHKENQDSGAPSRDYSLQGTVKLNLSVKRPGATTPTATGGLITRASLPTNTPDTAGVLKMKPPLLAPPSQSAGSSPSPTAKLNFSPTGRTDAPTTQADQEEWADFVG